MSDVTDTSKIPDSVARETIEVMARTSEELDMIEKNSLKEAFNFVGLDVLTIAQSVKDLIEAKRDADKLKALELIMKVRGDFAKAEIDERPIQISFGNWAKEEEKIEPDVSPEKVEQIREAVDKHLEETANEILGATDSFLGDKTPTHEETNHET